MHIRSGKYNEQILNKQKKCAFREFYFAFHLFEARFFVVLHRAITLTY
jgi:hypothetical protein